MLYVTLRQYEYVTAVAHTGSLTEAASRLAVSQPSLSVAISRVEQRLGQRIFLRGKGAALRLTPFGHRFVAGARALLDMAAELEQGRAGEAPFVLACFEDIAPWYLAPALSALTAALPNVPFSIREGRFETLAADLATGRADIALSYDLGFGPEFDRLALKQVAPVAFLSQNHPLAYRRALRIADLEGQPLVLFSEDQSLRHMMTLFRRLGLRMDIAHRTASLEMMRSLCAQGAGVGISYSVPPSGVSYDKRPLVTIPIADKEALAEISLIWSCLSPPHDAFDEIKTLLQKLA
ncbi:LysR family transcriptional regulator [Sulfitobacter aestuarii]|uniref:LysR family transcriptional regulator n=1 Tax=Sulfitobacter aestuarii TaxID=2161676 RepID=A0ABW5U3Z1_9RHOB